MEKSKKDLLIVITNLAATAVLGFSMYTAYNYIEKREQETAKTVLLTKVTYLADKDSDGETTDEEWKQVYETVGRSFTKFYTPSRDLTLEDLEKYISSYE